MTANLLLSHSDTLGKWALRHGKTRPRRPYPQPKTGLRFAFYGRMSTKEHQDEAASKGWQRFYAVDRITGGGPVIGAVDRLRDAGPPV